MVQLPHGPQADVVSRPGSDSFMFQKARTSRFRSLRPQPFQVEPAVSNDARKFDDVSGLGTGDLQHAELGWCNGGESLRLGKRAVSLTLKFGGLAIGFDQGFLDLMGESEIDLLFEDRAHHALIDCGSLWDAQAAKVVCQPCKDLVPSGNPVKGRQVKFGSELSGRDLSDVVQNIPAGGALKDPDPERGLASIPLLRYAVEDSLPANSDGTPVLAALKVVQKWFESTTVQKQRRA